MTIYEHIRQLGDKFYACTCLPLQSFDFSGNLIHAAGYNAKLTELFEHNNIFEQVRNSIKNDTASSRTTIACPGCIYFTARSICVKNVYRGFHILGPYTTKKDANLTGICYKPINCIPHLLTLLSNIAADSIFFKQKVKLFLNSAANPNVKKAIDILDARYHEPVTLSGVAAQLKISKSYLCSLFKKETGKTFSQYLNEIRIEKSKDLLLKQNMSVLDIALSVGFNNQNYYNMVFKKFMKHTPLEFRNHRKSS
ncbi:hypothetical protein P22_0807 [Propionispora sp. 2/2-37]|uniref:helix-turn-helix transcriptional regulator n=1 Tax=Propionispora sp. 2/2-37 TaxID=1677858 RepID=UPI0006BB6929|nr:AraC family transcriptional regulator [Propionispora sp. 2/2-37]CUH94741.1 hypothetical protein P22_0807 [Propionispora sp. 2/2-37]